MRSAIHRFLAGAIFISFISSATAQPLPPGPFKGNRGIGTWETTNTGKGTLYRVRIGPYASREIAAVARDKLKGEGYNGIVATK